MVGSFDDLLNKEKEVVARFVHSFESSRNTTTNLKESYWAASTNVDCVVRSQPLASQVRKEGLIDLDVILLLTKTQFVKLDVVKWNSKYYDVVQVEEVYWKGTLQYYKAICQRRLEFLGS